MPRVRPSRSVRRLPGPFPAVVAPVSTSHRISLPTLDGYSSRSQPVLRDVAGGWQAPTRASSARLDARPSARWARSPRSPGRAGSGSAGSGDRSWSARRAGRSSRGRTGSHGNADTRRTGRAADQSREPQVWRRGWDSNPRSLSTQRFSRAPPSTARPPLRGQDISGCRREAAGLALPRQNEIGRGHDRHRRHLPRAAHGAMKPVTIAELRSRPHRNDPADDHGRARRRLGHLVPGLGDPGVSSDTDWLTATLLSVFVGWLGVDRFYLGRTPSGSCS